MLIFITLLASNAWATEGKNLSSPPTLFVHNAQVRFVPLSTRSTTIYMSITNESDHTERLQDATSPIAEDVELHKIMNNRGLRRMHEVEEILIPPRSTLLLKVGSYHLMLVGLKKPLKVGESIPLELRFASFGKLTLTVPVVAMERRKKAKT